MLIKDIAHQLFYVQCNDTGTGDTFYRVSLTKAGSAIKSFSIVVGSAIAGTGLIMEQPKTALIVGMVFGAVGVVGAWLQDCGNRNAVGK